MNRALKEIFETRARDVLRNHDGIVHEWSQQGDSLLLRFPKQEDEGFDIIAHVDDVQITNVTDGDHRHF